MTGYPGGTSIHWGPVLPWLGAILAFLTGQLEGPGMVSLVSWIPVVVALLSIPLIFWFGFMMRGIRCGISAVLLISVIPGSYLIRSLYGYLDHHILESWFMLAYGLVFCVTLESGYCETGDLYWIPPTLL